MQNVILLARTIRDKKKLPIKQPLSKLFIISKDTNVLDQLKKLENYITEELNVFGVEYKSNEQDYVIYKISPNFQAIGERLGKPSIKVLRPVIEKLTEEQVHNYTKSGSIKITGTDNTEYELLAGEIVVDPTFSDKYLKDPKCGCASNLEGCAMLDIEITDELNRVRVARELGNHIQMARKEAGVNVEDAIDIYYSVNGEDVDGILKQHMDIVKKIIKVPFVELKHMPKISDVIYKDQYETVWNSKSQGVTYILCHSHIVVDIEELKKKVDGAKPAAINKALRDLKQKPYSEAKKELESGSLKVLVEKSEVILEKDKFEFVGIEDYVKSRK